MNLPSVLARLAWLVVFSFGALGERDSLQGAPTSESRPVAAPLERVAVIGASVSAGFHDSSVPLHPLSNPLRKILANPKATVTSYADAFFFLDPETAGARQVKSARAKKPSLVVAVDFLFWYGYGDLPSDEARFERLDKGLAEIGAFECAVLVGDLPDVRPGIGKMIRASQVPSVATLVKLNDRVREWAAARSNVKLLSLSRLLPKLYANDAFDARGNHWGAGESGRLLHTDKLHLTEEGTAALAVLALDRVLEGTRDGSQGALQWDLGAIRSFAPESRPARQLPTPLKEAGAADGGR